MSITRHACGVDPHGSDVISWRRRQLSFAGFETSTADMLAADPRWDLHAILQLVERGCPPSLAMRIHWPTEELERGT